MASRHSQDSLHSVIQPCLPPGPSPLGLHTHSLFKEPGATCTFLSMPYTAIPLCLYEHSLLSLQRPFPLTHMENSFVKLQLNRHLLSEAFPRLPTALSYAFSYGTYYIAVWATTPTWGLACFSFPSGCLYDVGRLKTVLCLNLLLLLLTLLNSGKQERQT